MKQIFKTVMELEGYRVRNVLDMLSRFCNSLQKTFQSNLTFIDEWGYNLYIMSPSENKSIDLPPSKVFYSASSLFHPGTAHTESEVSADFP